MHVFAVFLLLSFGVMALTMFSHHVMDMDSKHWTTTCMMLGVAMSWLAGFNMWSGWGVHLRYDWVGITLTGVALGGMAHFAHALYGFFAGLDKKFHDQAEVMEQHELRKVA